jgi:hypothetical protein
VSIGASSPSQLNRRAARRLVENVRDSWMSPSTMDESAACVLRAVLRRTDEPNLKEFCRAALEELRGK